MKKMKTIKLSFPWPSPNDPITKMYRVEQITDSIDYAPGKFLGEIIVNDLCHRGDWKVTIVAPK